MNTDGCAKQRFAADRRTTGVCLFAFAMVKGSFIQVQRALSKGKGLPKHFLHSDFNYAMK